jgi:uncharacterized membrane protein YqjE
VTDGEPKPSTGSTTTGSGTAGSAAAGPDTETRSTAPRTEAPGNGARAPEEMSVGELVFEVSDRASVLIREEIELAKTEVTEKVNRLLRGSVAGLAAGIFALLALFLIMHGIAWLLNDLVFDNFWAGFFVEAAVFLLIGAAAGLFAWRAFKRAAPPTPDMAIEEAKEIKAAFGEEEHHV